MFPSRFSQDYSYSIHHDSNSDVHESSSGPDSQIFPSRRLGRFRHSITDDIRLNVRFAPPDSSHVPDADEPIRIPPQPNHHRRDFDYHQQPSPALTSRATTWINNHTDFLSHHDPFPPSNTECPVCLEPCENHLCVKIINIPGCTHMIGAECLEAFLSNCSDNKKECPLCRTEWMPEVGLWEDELGIVEWDRRYGGEQIADFAAVHPTPFTSRSHLPVDFGILGVHNRDSSNLYRSTHASEHSRTHTNRDSTRHHTARQANIHPSAPQDFNNLLSQLSLYSTCPPNSRFLPSAPPFTFTPHTQTPRHAHPYSLPRPHTHNYRVHGPNHTHNTHTDSSAAHIPYQPSARSSAFSRPGSRLGGPFAPFGRFGERGRVGGGRLGWEEGMENRG